MSALVARTINLLYRKLSTDKESGTSMYDLKEVQRHDLVIHCEALAQYYCWDKEDYG